MSPGNSSYDLIVIGAGPGGYVAAIRAAQLGMKVACVEKDKTLGGTCLNVGCIPSKALLESSELYAQAKHKLSEHGIGVEKVSLDLKKFMERKEKIVKQLTGGIALLFKKNKITPVTGTAQIQKDKQVVVTQSGGALTLTAPHILIATGSRPTTIPGVVVDQKNIFDSTGALSLDRIPKEMVVIGGGYIGLELGSVFLRLGSEVTILEALDQILPGMDRDLGKNLQRILEKQGMNFKLQVQVNKANVKKDQDIEVDYDSVDVQSAKIKCDAVLVAVGRKPYTDGLGLSEAGIQTDEKGRIICNENFETTCAGVYAIGDVIAGPMLAHKASEEGVAVVEVMSGKGASVNYSAIPGVVYTWPEVASVGLTEEAVKQKGINPQIFKFPFLANGRALVLGEKEGFVKLIADKESDRLLGAHLLGPRASDLIAELTLAMEYQACAEDIARTIHAHPTLAEAVKEAALGLGSGAIHL